MPQVYLYISSNPHCIELKLQRTRLVPTLLLQKLFSTLIFVVELVGVVVLVDGMEHGIDLTW